jgi:hypothetical protein
MDNPEKQGHRTKTNNATTTKNTTQKIKIMSNTDPTKKQGVKISTLNHLK